MIYHYIKFFVDFFIGFSLALLLNDFFERKCPNEFEIYRKMITNLFVNASYNCIYYFSKFQIFAFQIKNSLNSFIESNPSLLKLKNDIDNLMKSQNASVTMTEFIKNGKALNIVTSDEKDFDFILYSWLSDNKKCMNKKIIYGMNETITTSELSDIKFMLIELKIGENIYKIDLKTETFNYYLVNNKFTKDFFTFYVKNHLCIKEEINDTDKYSLKLIDHDVNKIELDFTDKNEYIILEKNGYKLNVTNHSE